MALNLAWHSGLVVVKSSKCQNCFYVNIPAVQPVKQTIALLKMLLEFPRLLRRNNFFSSHCFAIHWFACLPLTAVCVLSHTCAESPWDLESSESMSKLVGTDPQLCVLCLLDQRASPAGHLKSTDVCKDCGHSSHIKAKESAPYNEKCVKCCWNSWA